MGHGMDKKVRLTWVHSMHQRAHGTEFADRDRGFESAAHRFTVYDRV